MRPVALRKRMPKVDGVSIPRSKFMVKAPLAKLALKPSPQAGARPILPDVHSINQMAPSGPAVMPAVPPREPVVGYSVTTLRW
jgi:hypothetical protein